MNENKPEDWKLSFVAGVLLVDSDSRGRTFIHGDILEEVANWLLDEIKRR